MLQHYGWETRYLDLVDDLQTGLWFEFDIEELHQEDDVNPFCDYGYLFVYGVKTPNKVSKGIFEGPHQRLINLREAIGPDALRPHVQSGYLLSDKNLFDSVPQNDKYKDFIKYVLCAFRVKKEILKEHFIRSNDLLTE